MSAWRIDDVSRYGRRGPDSRWRSLRIEHAGEFIAHVDGGTMEPDTDAWTRFDELARVLAKALGAEVGVNADDGA